MSVDFVTALERAAGVMLAPPSEVSPEERRNAEAVFHDAKREMTIDLARKILSVTSNQFVLFETAQLFGELVLREWAILEREHTEAVYKFLIEYVATREGLAHYVVAEFMRSAAMIIKRGILELSDHEDLWDMIHYLLSNSEARLQSVGCQLISALTEQFSTSWRNSKFSITWDFHVRAKSAFESYGLRKLLELSLNTLRHLCAYSDILNSEYERRLCDKFLEVAENILSWNFSTRVFRRLFSMTHTTNSFRPPASWQDLLRNDDFFALFFKLHGKVRHCEPLAVRSLSCLTQLAALSGDAVSDPDFATHFVRIYIESFLELFPTGPLPHEVHQACTMINRLFMYRPIQCLMRVEPELRSRFFGYFSQYTQHLTERAVYESISSCEHGNQASLSLLLDSWVLFLRSKWSLGVPEEQQDAVEHELLLTPAWEIVCTFLRSVQCSPNGSRPEAADEDNDEDADDRILFKDVLVPIGSIACHTLRPFLSSMTKVFRERLGELAQLACGAKSEGRVNGWREDMHWLLLVTANSVCGEDVDGSCHIQGEVFDLSRSLMRERNEPYSVDGRVTYLKQCIETPEAERTADESQIDPFVLLVGEVFAWASLEHQLILQAGPSAVSPELCRSTLFCLRRLLNAASQVPETDDTDSDPPQFLPTLPTDGPFSDLIISFCLHKVFTVLSKFSGEEKLCRDAVELLVGLVEARAPALAAAPDLFNHLASVDIARLPARTALMRALVLIGAAANDDGLRQNMYMKILEPLGARFNEICASSSTSQTDSLLVDLLQCFDGVAKASQPHSATVLFQFLNPVISLCVPLISSRTLTPTVLSSILTLLLDVTTKVSIYVEDKDDSIMLYRSLVAIVEAYIIAQKSRFQGMTSDDDEKAIELVLFMDILSNVLSKDILEDAEDRLSTGTQVAVHSLQMLLGVMSESVLEMPDVAMKFYRLILYLVEFSPECLSAMNEDLLHSLCECLKVGMTSKFGIEITSTCLESFAEVAMFFSNNRDKAAPQVVRILNEVLPLVFETCLETSCEQSVFSEACSCLFSIVCFDLELFKMFVHELLSRKSNAAASAKLQESFGLLFPCAPSPGRRERLAFRQRMEKFLNNIQGLLSCS